MHALCVSSDGLSSEACSRSRLALKTLLSAFCAHCREAGKGAYVSLFPGLARPEISTSQRESAIWRNHSVNASGIGI